MKWDHKHVLNMSDFDSEDVLHIFRTADSLKEIMSRPIKKVPTLRGKSVCTLFYENSTRTRTSFEMAAKMLSADTQSLTVATSSVAKGESFRDTLLTIEAMGLDLLVIRHSASGAPHQAAAWTGCHVINAGDGLHEHPTQGLLDLYTMRENKGDLAGLEVALVGDLQHSRVARSNIWGLLAMGANVRAVGPATLIPTGFHADRLRWYNNLEEGIRGADVVNVLRIQRERMDSGYLPSLREYALRYQINKRTLSLAKPDALLMHPGPMNRGVEIAPDVADGAHSVIVEQVTNGVAIRMALLFLMLGGSYDEVAN